MSKHTPGPWHRNVPPATKYPVVFSGRNTHVAKLTNDSRVNDEEAEANIDLIAAAPELLAACVAMIEWDDREKDHAVDFNARMSLCEAAFNAARAAIAKATGESNG